MALEERIESLEKRAVRHRRTDSADDAASRGRAAVLAKVKRVTESSDITEVARMLSSGNWIAIHATLCDPPVFILGKIAD